MRHGTLAALAAGLAALAGCATLLREAPVVVGPERIEAPPPQGPAPWTALEPLRDDDEFRFVVVTDRTGNHRDGVFESAMPKLNLVRPEFVVSVGDLIEGYTEDPAVLDRQWDEIQAAVARLEMPFFYAPGNHDMSNAVMAEAWHSRFGPSYYHFVYRDALFLVLNSELFGMVHDPRTSLPGPWTQADQMAFVERVLAEQAGARWTFVFVHQPLWDAREIHPDWLRVEALLGRRPYTVFAGHHHRYTEQRRNERQFITLATTGGGSPLRGTAWGEFDHVAQVAMTPQGPVIANLLLDGIEGAEVMTASRRKLVERLARAVTSEPLVGRGDVFRSGTARFRIANAGGQPLEVRGRPERGRDLDPDPAPISVTVAPRQAATVALPVRGLSAHRYESLAPARVRWTLATTNKAGERIEIETQSPILPERRFDARRTRRPTRVDGELGEWGPLAFEVSEPAEIAGPGRWGGPADASFRFDLRWDADHLYVAVDVRDDSIVASGERIAREQDHVSLSLDARPDPERSQNMGLFPAIHSGVMAKLVSVTAALEEPRRDEVMRLFTGPPLEGVRWAAARTATGYAAEIEVPHEILDARRGAAWDALRLNVTVTDFDAGERDFASIAWRPSRFGEQAIPGSGTFSRR
jgi:hypothetical protein